MLYNKFSIFNYPLSILIVVAFFLAGCKREAPQIAEQPTDSNLVELNSIQMKQITTDTVKVQEERTDPKKLSMACQWRSAAASS